MLRCYVTDRRRCDLLTSTARAVRDGVNMIQVREKDLSAWELFDLVCRIKDLAAGSTTKILVNERLDIALAAGIDGVHLPEDGLPAGRVRPHVRLLGASVHSVDAARGAEAEGADFVIFGPVFETPRYRTAPIPNCPRPNWPIPNPNLQISKPPAFTHPYARIFPTNSVTDLIPRLARNFDRPASTCSVARGSWKFAVPICTAVAPA